MPSPTPLLLTTILLLILAPAAQAQQQQQLSIYTPTSSRWTYQGCYNETTDLPGTAGARAIDGKSLVSPGSMTVQSCLDFCASSTYKYSGLQFSRECWCGNILSGLSKKMPDGECNTACDGDATIVCGGSMKLSVYIAGVTRATAEIPGILLLAAIVACGVGNLL